MSFIGEMHRKRASRRGHSSYSMHWLGFTALAAVSWISFDGRLFAQEAALPPVDVESTAPRAGDDDSIPEGLWPSPKLMRLMLSRWAEEAAHQYDLDAGQRVKVRDATVERWSRFLDEHRAELQPIANEFVEMRMELEPPDKERVAKWAARASPAFELVRRQLDEGAEEFRKVLRPMQRAKFEVDALQMKVGLNFAERRIRQWQSGEYDRDDFWEPLPADRESRRAKRRREREEREAADRNAQAEAKEKSIETTDQIALELEQWDQYVNEFILAHDLDAGQRTSVLSFLSELKERAVAHRDRYREEIEKLEKRIAAQSKTEKELEEINRELTRLYGPIDDMFKELQNRIAQVPTVEQRAAAAVKPRSEAPPKTSVQKTGPVEPAKPVPVPDDERPEDTEDPPEE